VRAGNRHTTTGIVGKPVGSGGEDKRGNEALYVPPLPGCGQCLVQVVNVEDQTAFRGGETTEIHQMRVATALNANSRNVCPDQVGRHDPSGTAVEREWGLQHSPIAKRHQLRLPGHIGSAQDVKRVCPVGMRPPSSVRIAGTVSRNCLPAALRSSGVMGKGRPPDLDCAGGVCRGFKFTDISNPMS
jgi:hypothetical protein